MDLSYTDPSFHPVYTLQGISQSLLEVQIIWINSTSAMRMERNRTFASYINYLILKKKKNLF